MADDTIGVTSFDEVFFGFGPHRIQGWPASGTFIAPSRLTPEEVKVEAGVDNLVSVIKVKSTATFVSITLARESRSNTVLWLMLQAQRNAPGVPFHPLWYQHKTTKMASGLACIAVAPAGAPLGDGPQQLGWTFFCPQFDGVLTGLAINGEV